MRTWILVFGISIVAFPVAVYATEERTGQNAIAHRELRALRTELFDAYENRDIEQLLVNVHSDAIITWQNGETNRGRQDLREFYERMLVGEDRVVQSLTSKLTVDDTSIIHGGDAAIAFGSIDDHYRLTDGTDFKLQSRWTATMVKQENRWVVASFHISANLFDNPILEMAKSYLLYVGSIAALVGVLLGAVGVKLVAKLRKTGA